MVKYKFGRLSNVADCMFSFSGAYLVLEGYGGSGESSTDDDIQVGRKELGLAHSCAADSGISLKFSSPSSGSTSRLSRQVLSHLRSLQANLNHLKVKLLIMFSELGLENLCYMHSYICNLSFLVFEISDVKN